MTILHIDPQILTSNILSRFSVLSSISDDIKNILHDYNFFLVSSLIDKQFLSSLVFSTCTCTKCSLELKILKMRLETAMRNLCLSLMYEKSLHLYNMKHPMPLIETFPK